MNLDDQLEELLARLGVVLEVPHHDSAGDTYGVHGTQGLHGIQGAPPRDADRATGAAWAGAEGDGSVDEEARAEAEISLFQASREHYGVFYRLDLAGGAPQLRVFVPEDAGAVKMRCYLVRATIGSPVRDWFLSTRAHQGSDTYLETRDTTEQHLLFAAGESLKRLFWSGDTAEMLFPPEIEVARLM